MNKFRFLIVLFTLAVSACKADKSVETNPVLTVDHLINSSSNYASKIVTVRGEIVMDYHGPTLCDESGSPCFFVVLPERVFPNPEFVLDKDHAYEEYLRLSLEIGSIQRTLGKAQLFATLRGRFDNYDLLPNGKEVIVQNPPKGSLVRRRFVLQKVVKLDVRRLN